MGSLFPLRLTAAEALSVKISCVGTAPLSDAIDRLIVFSHRRGTHTRTHIRNRLQYKNKNNNILSCARFFWREFFDNNVHRPRIRTGQYNDCHQQTTCTHTDTQKTFIYVYSSRRFRNDCPPRKVTVHIIIKYIAYRIPVNFPRLFGMVSTVYMDNAQ